MQTLVSIVHSVSYVQRILTSSNVLEPFVLICEPYHKWGFLLFVMPTFYCFLILLFLDKCLLRVFVVLAAAAFCGSFGIFAPTNAINLSRSKCALLPKRQFKNSKMRSYNNNKSTYFAAFVACNFCEDLSLKASHMS